MTSDLLSKFNERIEHVGECWVWTGYVSGTTYKTPQFTSGKLKLNPRRLLYEHEHGPLGAKQLGNLCGNQLCVNPAHWKIKEKNPRANAECCRRYAERHGKLAGKPRKTKPTQRTRTALQRVRALAEKCGYRLVKSAKRSWSVERA